ncbi:hypothetical protein [Sphingomonas lycopersici]|uniref:Uncharacterized protein n=2 Tax=Sphingomonas TaxID=13687 RepID=A0AA41ZGM4_9SPHN|nr:hypothetical protein [Sphingomonas lycopersici]MCW6536559.1 hypothetical protein [Sphingomonas lycopersici]
MSRDTDDSPRLNLVIPSIAPSAAFGGVLTGLDLYLRLVAATGARARIILDDFDLAPDRSVVDAASRRVGVDPARIAIAPRRDDRPAVSVGARDIFIAYNWWTVLNIRELVAAQAAAAGGRAAPYLYICQDFEPGFYPFSSTHLVAWRALKGEGQWWAIYNSSELAAYVGALGIAPAEQFVIEPTLSAALRPFLPDGAAPRERRMLVYGRPGVPRNCFPAVIAGLRAWAGSYAHAAQWDVVSAGAPHRPLALGNGIELRAAGKLSLEDYAAMLRGTAVGLSLMASPHPSYPPLEMAHFGVLTVTSDYAFKSLGAAHDNIVALDDIRADSIAAALADACERFERDPTIGARGRSHRPDYLAENPYPFLETLAARLNEAWRAG